MIAKSIFAEIKPEEKDKANAVLKVLRLTLSDIKLEDIRYTDFEDKTVLSFKFNEKHSKKVAERFALNGINIISPDEESQEVINLAKKKLERKDSKGFDGWSKKGSEIDEEKLSLPISTLVKDGEFETLLAIIKDVRAEEEKRKEAESKLDEAIANAIKSVYTTGLEAEFRAEESIKKLIALSTNSQLKFMKKIDFPLEAGRLSIKLACSYRETLFKLVDIYNNSLIERRIAFEAAIVFVGKVISVPEPNQKAANYAIKKSNLPTLQTLLTTLEKDLNNNEITIFKKLIDFVNQRRKFKPRS